jgi:hypothetical protein
MARVNTFVTTFPRSLAPSLPSWHSATMAKGQEPKAGGALLAGSILAGAVIGIAMRQATIGVLAGIAVGIVAALLLWWRDRR